MKPTNLSLVVTIGERCRVCYTCVRECPAKAIRIASGQAEVIPSRCIGCGCCVRVCSQGAKEVLSSVGEVRQLLRSGARVAACVAPSFPAEFGTEDETLMVGRLRRLGFALVCEVGFGADLVARAYRKLLEESGEQRFIGSSCPAIVNYVERYHPELVPYLAPVVSPMLATARALRRRYGDDLKVVFIGPCIAKKGEAAMTSDRDRIDAALTFRELRAMFAAAKLDIVDVAPSDFDPPRAALGNVFPLPRGSLQTAGLQEDLTNHDVVTAHGRSAFPEALIEFSSGGLKARLLEILCCGGGCVMGAGMSSTAPPFTRRSRISRYAHRRSETFDNQAWLAETQKVADVPLERSFRADNQSLPVPNAAELTALMIAMGKQRAEDELNCGACGYDTCREHAIAIYRGLAEHAMCLPFTIERLRQTVEDLDRSHTQLATAQQALVQAEKLASMGQLSAGIAHEVNNPLGVVLLYAHILLDNCESGTPLYKDMAMIVEQADRCKKIVAGLLDFARQNKVVLMPTGVVDLFARALRSVPLLPNIAVVVEHADPALMADLDVDQMNQVLTNLITNAVAAMPQGGRLTLRSGQNGDQVWFSVEDTGQGIPRENLNRVFEPFFTTRQMGRGTGLGLAVSYGIMKMHRGGIRVKSNADPAAGPTGSIFTVTFPRLERREENLPLFAADAEGNEPAP